MRKNGNGNVFQNPMKTVANLFEEKNADFYFHKARPEILSHKSKFFFA